MKPQFPNLYIIGAMKSGTTSLHDYLSKHPDIFMSTPKEIHYYSKNNRLTEEEYLNYFITEKKIVGTSPQGYTKIHHVDGEGVPEKIFNDTPNAKLIYIVRDPIERYKSHIVESYHVNSKERISYNKSIDHCLKTSMYFMQIAEYLKFFKKEQIHVLSLEDLQENRLQELNKIFKFLGVATLTNENLFNFKSNVQSIYKLPYIVRSNIIYRAINKISPAIATKSGVLVSKIFLKKYVSKPELTKTELGKLKEKLQPDVDKLREFTGLKFAQWQL